MKKPAAKYIIPIAIVGFLALTLIVLCIVISVIEPWGEREYLPDLYVEVPDTEYVLLIKEWRYLLGSGEDVYLVSPSGKKPKLLGKLTGGNDGYCPFADGKYEVRYEDSEVHLSWAFNAGAVPNRSKSFTLPEKAS